MALLDAFYSLGNDVNKVGGKDISNDTQVGVVGEFLPELSLSMPDDKLIATTEKWEKKWQQSAVRATWIKQVNDNEKYWMGEHFSNLDTSAARPLVDNIVWQAVETYLPSANRTQPEPLVEVRSTEPQDENNLKYAKLIRDRLADWTADVHLPQKLEKAGRSWLLSLVGIAKMGWDPKLDRATCVIIRPNKAILDPEAVSDEDGYSGEYVGHYRKMKASSIIDFVEKEGRQKEVEYIRGLAKGDLGTEIQFIEWWTDEYTCWTCNKHVLLKKKNLHWNWENSAPEQVLPDDDDAGVAADNEPPELIEDSVDHVPAVPTGSGQMSTPQNDTNIPIPSPFIPNAAPPPPPAVGANHFPAPRKPFVFLSIFNLGKTPVDETSLVSQILPQQDAVNKRERQLDKYADGLNGGVVVSEERSGLSREEATEVTEALRLGGTVVIPAGAANEAVYRLPSNPLPPDVYNNLVDNRNRVYDLFGIKGLTASGIENETTVRGKIITKGLDTDRIGGGVTPYFEIFAGEILDWVVQLIYVYDDVFTENPGARPPKLKVGIKPGSLLPKDATTKANQAIELANAGKMALVDLYKALEFSNPEEMAMNVWLEANAPEILFKDDPRMQEAMQLMSEKMKAAAGGEKDMPSRSINFKDLPPEGKAQLAAQAGIELAAEEAASYEIVSEAMKKRPPGNAPERPNIPNA